MSYTFLQELGEESSAESFSDIPAFVLLRLNLIADESCSNGKEMESFQSSQFGMMSAHSMENLGGGRLMSCAAGSHVKTSVLQIQKEKVSLGEEADCGQKWQELLVKYDPDTHSWKTHRCLLNEDLPWFLVTLPRWGMMLNGLCWGRIMSALPTREKEFGFLPTPQAADRKDTGPHGSKSWKNHIKRRSLLAAFVKEPNNSGRLNPEFSEWLMGWIIGWTDLNPLEMDRFHKWLRLHGKL